MSVFLMVFDLVSSLSGTPPSFDRALGQGAQDTLFDAIPHHRTNPWGLCGSHSPTTCFPHALWNSRAIQEMGPRNIELEVKND